LLVKPRLVLSVQKPGQAEEHPPVAKPQRIIAPETAIQMRRMMEGVVLHGTGKRAILKGYTSGGKTGSAQIYDLKAHVYTHHYNASFLGFAPVANPQIVIVVTLEGTSGGTAGFGGPVAAPVFREVATSALRMLDVPKDLPDGLLRSSRETADENDLAIAGLGAPPLEDPGTVTPSTQNTGDKHPRSVSSVTPPPVRADSPASAGESVSDRRPFLNSGLTGPKVPDFRGMALRSVLEESAARGLELEVSGSGMARSQEPAPGMILPPGERVRVQFSR
jgi:membrane peptidoglycan carboxypeptidase